jgi:nitrogen fixation-related uncharacterized protein
MIILVCPMFPEQKWSIQRHWRHWATKNGQYRDTGNIGQTRMVNTETLETLGNQKWSIQRHWKHWATTNGQYRDTGNIGQPRMVNTEALETLGKQE